MVQHSPLGGRQLSSFMKLCDANISCSRQWSIRKASCDPVWVSRQERKERSLLFTIWNNFSESDSHARLLCLDSKSNHINFASRPHLTHFISRSCYLNTSFIPYESSQYLCTHWFPPKSRRRLVVDILTRGRGSFNIIFVSSGSPGDRC